MFVQTDEVLSNIDNESVRRECSNTKRTEKYKGPEICLGSLRKSKKAFMVKKE